MWDDEGGREEGGRGKGGGREKGGRRAVKEATLGFLFSSILWITGRQMHLFPLCTMLKCNNLQSPGDSHELSRKWERILGQEVQPKYR